MSIQQLLIPIAILLAALIIAQPSKLYKLGTGC